MTLPEPGYGNFFPNRSANDVPEYSGQALPSITGAMPPSPVNSTLSKEPGAAYAGGIGGIGTVLMLLAHYFPHLDESTRQVIAWAIMAGSVAAVTWFTRRKTFSQATVDAYADAMRSELRGLRHSINDFATAHSNGYVVPDGYTAGAIDIPTVSEDEVTPGPATQAAPVTETSSSADQTESGYDTFHDPNVDPSASG